MVNPEIDPAAWEAFIPGAINGTIFNSLRFLSYHPCDRFESHHLCFRRKGNLVGILPAAIITDGDGARTLVSHPGASYGGPAYSPALRYHHVESLVSALVDYTRRMNLERIKLTPPPVIYNDQPEQTLSFALMRQGFTAARTELTQAVRLDVSEASLLNSFVNKTRTAFRKAEKEGLKFRVIENPTQAEYDRFWEILVENRQGLGVVPAHSRAEIERLHQLIPDKLMMGVIEHDGTMVATIWNFICNPYTLLEFYMAHVAEYQALRPVTFLTYHTILWARARGFRYLDFGISSIWSDPTWGLLRFKENFNSRHFLRITYQKDL